MQAHGHHLARRAPFSGQGGDDFRQLQQLFGAPELQQRAHAVVAAHAGAEKAQQHGLAHHQAELLRVQRHLRALFHAKRRQAQRAQRRLHARNGGQVALYTHVVALRRATANAHATPQRVHIAQVGGAARHSQIQLRAFEQARGRRTFLRQPAVEHLHDALLNQRCLEHAAVEQQRRGPGKAGALGLGQGTGLARQKRGQMAGDGGILRIGQTQLREGAARARLRCVAHGAGREKAFHQRLQHLGARDLGANAAANQFAAPAGHHHGQRFRGAVAEQLLFRGAAGLGQGAGLPSVQRFALGGELARHAVGQRQVHVVAAQQNVLAHRQALQLQVAVLLLHGNE